MKKIKLLILIASIGVIILAMVSCGDDCDCSASNTGCTCDQTEQKGCDCGDGNNCDCGDVNSCDCGDVGGCDCGETLEGPYFELDSYYKHLSVWKNTFYVTVYSNLNWAVTANSYDIEITPDAEAVPDVEGMYHGDGKVKLVVPQNDTGKERFFVITFTYFVTDSVEGRRTVTLTLHQAA